MDEADGERVMKAAREVLDGIVEDARLFLVSSRDALRWRRKEAGESLKPSLVIPDSLDDTGFAQFEASLADYLSREKGNAKLAKYQSRLRGWQKACWMRALRRQGRVSGRVLSSWPGRLSACARR